MADMADDILRGFHVSGLSRDKYQFDLSLFVPIGKTDIPDFLAARTFASQMNRKRDTVQFPEQAVRASEINAVALIHGVTQYVFRAYMQQVAPKMLQDALAALQENLGAQTVDETLDKFADSFPPLAVYTHTEDRETFLNESTNGVPNRQLVLEEMLMLWLSNANPAFSTFFELFGDDPLNKTGYPRIIAQLYRYFNAQVDDGGGAFTGGENILDFLLAPARNSPHSLEGQLSFLMSRWSGYIGSFIYRLLRGVDFMKEEEFKPTFGIGGPSNVPVISFNTPMEAEPENFTPDRDWMPRLVLIAKNSYVWLDQLSKKYGRDISRLDQIPDEELEQLGRWGVTGLWLIGLWERSRASQTIKQIMGNPDAVASAYSLLDYRIADALGGEEACAILKQRAWKYGIRLASDMVPNHVGIDGKWVIEHPDWFVSLPYSPYPNYTFNSVNLSPDQRYGIQIEDNYFNKTDAAVVFKRTDTWTGDTRYIYHGNDGTSMPWNDTAQLNYLNPDVREAMMQTIIDIARRFPIIRFDAAMTLVKRHYHRLWYPEPGGGGDIPSRSEHGMTRAQFDELMPEEFWRELVDRAAVEAPDTLLLAEAFWLMESYFVRTLGMHRVYNSAYMNMMRDEKNAEYRQVMKNTLEFDPEVLKRYVNFMNNPDERTAVDQFGKGDKYFGVATVLMTLPGLPMLGHGQIEGFSEKYGMEYRRAYYDEKVDQWLIQRHEREIFPLAHKRYLFAGSDHFLLYDFFTGGGVDEDVYAYSNRYGDERGLVVYNNKFAATRGWIRTSAAFAVKTGRGDEKVLVQRTLGEGLGLQPDSSQFCIFRDQNAGLDYIRSSKELCEQGMYIELGGYGYRVFIDFRVVMDDVTQQYAQLAAYLGGRGVPNMQEALQELFVQPIHVPFKALVNVEVLEQLMDARGGQNHDALLNTLDVKLATLLNTIDHFIVLNADEEAEAMIVEKARAKLTSALHTETSTPQDATQQDPEVIAEEAQITAAQEQFLWGTFVSWLYTHSLGEIAGSNNAAARSRSWMDEWLLGRVIATTLQTWDLDEFNANQVAALVKVAIAHQTLMAGTAEETPDGLLNALLQDADTQRFLRINRYQDVLWFDKEAFEHLLRWLSFIARVENAQSGNKVIAARQKVITQLQKALKASGYQVEKLRTAAKPRPKRKTLTSEMKAVKLDDKEAK
jgi:glycosidase